MTHEDLLKYKRIYEWAEARQGVKDCWMAIIDLIRKSIKATADHDIEYSIKCCSLASKFYNEMDRMRSIIEKHNKEIQ